MSNESPQKCDLLIRNGYVITMDPERSKHPNGAVAVDGNTIVAVGPEQEITTRYSPLRGIDAKGAAVHPGFIDLHYHATTYLISKLIEDTPVPTGDAGPWVAENYGRFRAMEDEDQYASCILTGLDMLKNGFTMFMDPGTIDEPDIMAEVCEALGLRASLADPAMLDIHGPQQPEQEAGFYDTERCLKGLGKQLWRNDDPDSLVRAHVSIYGMGSQSVELMKAAKACADEHDVPFNMHQSQSIDDAGFDRERFGKAPYMYWAELGLLDDRCSFVHNNILWKEELQPIIDSGMTLVWVPGNSFYYRSRKTFPTEMPGLYHRGVNITFGIDVCKTWTFGQNSLLAYNIAREEEQYLFPDDLLAIQTINGAKALLLEDRLGSLEPGKRADIVIRRNDLPEAVPQHHIERALMLHTLTKNVDTVIVDGRIVVKNGHHTLIDEEVVYQLGQKAADRMLERAGVK